MGNGNGSVFFFFGGGWFDLFLFSFFFNGMWNGFFWRVGVGGFWVETVTDRSFRGAVPLVDLLMGFILE